jgi:hypothetical protein
MRAVDRGKRKVGRVEIKKTRNMIEGDLDEFDVRHWFALDPLDCVNSPAARHILRSQNFGWRPWVGTEYDNRRLLTEIIAPVRWQEGFWNGLSGSLEELVGAGLGSRFADCLVGFLLVINNETPGRNYENRENRITQKQILHDHESAAKRDRDLHRLKRIVGSPATSRPQRRESLQLVLSKAMLADLVRSGLPRKSACELRLPQIWAMIGIKIDSASILRMERRSRNKNRRPSKR